MKLSHLFWGILLVTIGLLFLLNNFSPLYLDWESLINLWPLAFIFWGISIILKENKIVRASLVCLVAIILAFCVFSTYKFIAGNVNDHFDFDNDNGFVYEDNSSSQNLNSYSLSFSPQIKNATLKLNGGAGIFKITGETDSLFRAYAYGEKNNYELMLNNDSNGAEINFNMKNVGFHVNNNKKNEVNIRLNPNPVWEINCGAGAANMNFDLAPFKIRDFDVDMGAAKLQMKLGNLSDTTNVDVNGGASKIEINIPSTSACEIRTDNFLSSNHFEGFDKVSSGLYRTPNFSNSDKKIFIKFNTGVASLRVERY